MLKQRSCRHFLQRLALLASFLSSTTFARAPEPFLNLTLKEAAEKNKFILLHFFAGWCPSCQAQKKVLAKIMVQDEDLRKVVTLVVPYDDAHAVRKEYKVNRQSTLIILKGKKELARDAGTTEKSDLVKFLKTHIPSD